MKAKGWPLSPRRQKTNGFTTTNVARHLEGYRLPSKQRPTPRLTTESKDRSQQVWRLATLVKQNVEAKRYPTTRGRTVA